jgi:SAM-dependent methyltransferase
MTGTPEPVNPAGTLLQGPARPARREQMPFPYLGRNFALGTGRIRILSEAQRKIRDAIVEGDVPEDYQDVPCLCGPSGPDILLATVERHGLACRNVLCARCGLIRISPRWSESRYSRFYETEYRDLYNRIDVSKEKFALTASESGTVRKIAAWAGQSFQRHGKASGSVVALEIGAGAGWNLANLPSSWRKVGFDVDKDYLDLGQRLFGLEMKFGLLEEAWKEIPGADLILLSHVVEHFMDPVAALKSISDRMKPGALLLIEVPGIFRIHGSALDPMTFLQNAHTFTFCSGTLNATCAGASLRVLESDETCRAVCMRSSEPLPVGIRDHLPGAILRYLKMCELCCRVRDGLRSLPAGRYFAAAWRKLSFPPLKWLVPSASPSSSPRR